MSNFGRVLISAAAFAALAAFASGAQAANVIVGSPLIGPFVGDTFTCGISPCTVVQDVLPGATLTSPVDGVVVRWQLMGADGVHEYKVRVLKPAGGSVLTGAGTSAPVTPIGPDKESFPTALPIRAGQPVGINLVPGASIAERGLGNPNFHFLSFRPILIDGQSREPTETFASELAFNAEVQPAPKIAAITPAAGSVRGGTTVVIAGADLEGASAVSFGGVAAAGYRVDSEGQITAVAPAVGQPSAVPVSVTTIAGTATSPTPYGYLSEEGGCKVPKLKGKTLKAARKLVRKSGCRLGRVKRHHGATAKGTKVVAQRPKPGKLLAPGAKVNLTIVDHPADV